MIRAAAIGLLLAGMLGAGRAGATSCTVSAQPVAFGVYDPMAGTPTTSTAAISVGCQTTGVVSVAVSYTVALSAGSGGYGARSMVSGGSALGYQLYADALGTQVWGDGTGGTTTANWSYLLAVGPAITHGNTVYGVIAARQTAVQPGSYADTITVMLTY